jgi:hypothetical protein
MLVKMRSVFAGPQRTAGPGDVIEVPDDQAGELIDGGYAEAVDADGNPAPRPETATAKGKGSRTAEKG